jgi:ubiquinone/menaquinone biosynthesis C-methylase UbiE
MIQSKAWNWKVAISSYWQEAAPEIYPLVNRWKKLNLNKFLDLGCGVGRHALLFAKNGFEVTASDLSTDGLEKLKEIAKEQKLKMDIQTADMVSLPFKDETFDCLIAFHAIYHTDEVGIKKVMAEIRRVLKKDGEALITFNSQNNSAFKDARNQHISTNVVVKNTGHEAGIPHYYATKSDVEELVKDFEIVEFGYREEYWNSEGLGANYVSAHYCVLVKNP